MFPSQTATFVLLEFKAYLSYPLEPTVGTPGLLGTRMSTSGVKVHGS